MFKDRHETMAVLLQPIIYSYGNERSDRVVLPHNSYTNSLGLKSIRVKNLYINNADVIAAYAQRRLISRAWASGDGKLTDARLPCSLKLTSSKTATQALISVELEGMVVTLAPVTVVRF